MQLFVPNSIDLQVEMQQKIHFRYLNSPSNMVQIASSNTKAGMWE
jgi:hypothetical protein